MSLMTHIPHHLLLGLIKLRKISWTEHKACEG